MQTTRRFLLFRMRANILKRSFYSYLLLKLFIRFLLWIVVFVVVYFHHLFSRNLFSFIPCSAMKINVFQMIKIFIRCVMQVLCYLEEKILLFWFEIGSCRLQTDLNQIGSSHHFFCRNINQVLVLSRWWCQWAVMIFIRFDLFSVVYYGLVIYLYIFRTMFYWTLCGSIQLLASVFSDIFFLWFASVLCLNKNNLWELDYSQIP